ncbi:16S rRNA (cytosine(967)-C(5))-methyltransferase RsmB [Pyrofollis japonicus]|uniref:RsmB/NOP family class I SAM-dependent RNA methyltransferase n=1 Tax=Pyrofollis japonicus TaxID=3060460 RepID=UPI00295B0E94|nr:RsmB/NOP family class I SAM-dependent RNA methyltransferase [Pyrofollis japonicus]BEP18673.1 16S rRNA (cytosine(967)-C(5))-methyltransferase RsmB [Pyrofollis japonicus]
MHGELVETTCAKILSRVEATLYSIRYFIERERPQVPRPLLNALCLGVLRNYRLLVHALRRCGYRGEVRGRPRGWIVLVGAYEAMFREVVSIDRIVDATGLSREVVQCLRGIVPEEVVDDLQGLRKLAILYSLPDWVVEELAKTNPPGGLEALLKALQEPTPLWIRINKSIISREEAIGKLEELGIRARPDPVLDDLLEAVDIQPGALGRLDQRLFYVQDRAAALIAHVAKEGRLVVDLFSAPGNKASHLAWRGAAGYIAGLELSRRRTVDEKKLTRKQGVWIIDPIEADALDPPLRRNAADLVIIDPDCTSMGRLGHSPETRLFLERAGKHILNKLVKVQIEGLRTAAKSARRGARIVYSTCTLTLEENEKVVQTVAEEEGLVIAKAEPMIGVEGLVPGTQRIYPHISRCTGGFVALLLKE